MAAGMGWNQLASIIADLELEKYELREYHTLADIQEYDQLIEIYEIEKARRVQSLKKSLPYGEQFMYGLDFLTSWNDD